VPPSRKQLPAGQVSGPPGAASLLKRAHAVNHLSDNDLRQAAKTSGAKSGAVDAENGLTALARGLLELSPEERRRLPQKIALACVSSRMWPHFGLVILRAQALPAYGLATPGALDKQFWLVGN